MVPSDIQQVAVVGAGTMGHGIALQFARYDRSVTLFDVQEEALDEAAESIVTGLETLATAGHVSEAAVDSIPDRIEATTSYDEAADDADLIVEAAPEDAEVKRDVFGRLDEHAPESAIIATNTSGLSITDLADRVANPERVLGTHWFNPPYVVPLVEVIYGEQTADEPVDLVYDLLEEIGKTPIVVNEDIPGFVANRIQLAMDYEAWSLLDRGIASAEDIDRAIKAGFGLRVPALGTFKKSDFAGLDVIHDIQSYMTEDLDRGTEPSESLVDLVEDGHLGVKSGGGVFDWSDRDREEVLDERDQQLLALVELYEEMEASSD